MVWFLHQVYLIGCVHLKVHSLSWQVCVFNASLMCSSELKSSKAKPSQIDCDQMRFYSLAQTYHVVRSRSLLFAPFHSTRRKRDIRFQ